MLCLLIPVPSKRIRIPHIRQCFLQMSSAFLHTAQTVWRNEVRSSVWYALDVPIFTSLRQCVGRYWCPMRCHMMWRMIEPKNTGLRKIADMGSCLMLVISRWCRSWGLLVICFARDQFSFFENKLQSAEQASSKWSTKGKCINYVRLHISTCPICFLWCSWYKKWFKCPYSPLNIYLPNH